MNDNTINVDTVNNIDDIQVKDENIHKSGFIQKYYGPNEINTFRLNNAIENNFISKITNNKKSQIAFKNILSDLSPTSKYLLPGQLVLFEYNQPKNKEDLKYYDRTPLVLFFGITRTPEGNIREIGINLHFFPPSTRANIMNTLYEVFKTYYKKQFNEASSKENNYISWKSINHLLKKYKHIAFGVRMYIPSLRRKSYVIPTRLFSTAFYTEGNFAKETMSNIFRFWKTYKR